MFGKRPYIAPLQMIFRVIGTVSAKKDLTCLALLKPLNAECFDGILDWSHCWIIFLNESNQIVVELFEIHSVEKKKLLLRYIGPELTCVGQRVVDIKPLHPLDL